MLSSAIGHLLELVAPEGVEVKRGKWSFANLPVIPPHFDLRPIERTEDRLKLLLKLLKRKDVTGVINACDAGREGELIFRYIMQHAGNKKPIQRLWLQSMTQGSIRDGFDGLRTDKSMLPLADAAVCRSESDWLVGINGTRAMTAFNSKEGGFYKTTVGRVQTPTLAILVEREDRIKKFVSRDYWEVHATFAAAAGSLQRPLVRREVRQGGKGRGRRSQARAPVGCGAGRGLAQEVRGQARHRHRGGQTHQPDFAAAVRSDQPAARSERTLRLLRAHHAVAGAGPVRKAQGADLPAYRCARVAGRLSADGQIDHGNARRQSQRQGQERGRRGVCAVRAPGVEGRLGQAEQAHFRQLQDLRPLRHHSRRCRRRAICRTPKRSSTTWS